MEQYLVFDIGGTFIKYALMGADGTMGEKGQVPSPLTDVTALLDAMTAVGAQYAGQYAGAAVSMPGRIDTKNGIAHTGGSFTFIHDTPFAAGLQERLHVPVVLANDGKCAANAELRAGALSDVDNGCVIVLGTGTGGGIVVNGRVWMGHTFAAGELSLLPASLEDVSHGITGHSDETIGRMWAHHMSATGLLWRYAVRKGLPHFHHGVDGFAFFKAYDAGEAEAVEALADFARIAAAGIYAVQSVLDLQRYAIGGGISARPEVTEAIRTALDAQFTAVPFTPFGKPEVVRCRFGNDANLIGALHFLLENAGQ